MTKTKSKSKLPKKKAPGEKGYKTPTQLRNARKRRAKQKSSIAAVNDDPSQTYLSNPRKSPIVQKAIQFFSNKLDNKSFPIHLGPLKEWRTVAKLAVRNNKSQQVLSIGLFVPNSHQLLAIPNCPAHHPSINQTVQILQETCRRLKIVAFDETTGLGQLRHVAINVERSTGAVQVTLVWNAPESDETLDKLCQAVMQESQIQLHSLWVHYNCRSKHANAIFDYQGRWEKRQGADTIIEYLNIHDNNIKVPLHFPPNVFRQANLDAFTAIVQAIRNYLKRYQKKQISTHCLELYGGVGTIGLHVADLCASLVSSDENPHNQACFEQSAKQIKTSATAKICYKPLNAIAMVESGALHQADWVIVDPPRKGLDAAVVQALTLRRCEQRPQILVYVSCGFDAFQRDYHQLVVQGKWNLEHAEGHILFPGSDAIETLAFFKR